MGNIWNLKLPGIDQLLPRILITSIKLICKLAKPTVFSFRVNIIWRVTIFYFYSSASQNHWDTYFEPWVKHIKGLRKLGGKYEHEYECLVCYFLFLLTLFCTELPENCIYLNQSELSNFFMYIICIGNHMIFLVQFGINKHAQFVVFEKINKCLFVPNCTRKIMWLRVNNIHK